MEGWLFWTDQINSCGQDQNCINQKRIDVSAAFLMSDEFQQSGDFIYRLYRAGLGRQLTYAEFTDDHQKVIGGADLESQRTQFADRVRRPCGVRREVPERGLGRRRSWMHCCKALADAQLDLSSQREALIAHLQQRRDLNDSRAQCCERWLKAMSSGARSITRRLC